MLGQIVQAGRLNRSFYASLLHDQYAAGNAVAVIVLTTMLPALAARSVVLAASTALWSIVRAGLAAWVLRTAGVHLFRGYGETAAAFRMVGFAHIAVLPLAARPWAAAGWLRTSLLVLALVWFYLALRAAADALFNMKPVYSRFMAVAGLFGWYIGGYIGPAPLRIPL